MQKEFVNQVIAKVKDDETVLALAVAGSWITGEIDDYSDVDLILFTRDKITGDKEAMLEYAKRFGSLISAFTGEHVGEPKLLICLYDAPLLHVDIKFLAPEEYIGRVEDPVIVFERDRWLTDLLSASQAKWPYPDYQWIEDRFWTWVHYAALKLGRGEYFEALDFLSYIRTTVLAPLLQIKNGNLPRGLRKVESKLSQDDLEALKATVARYDVASLFASLDSCVALYQGLREELFGDTIRLQDVAEIKVLGYLESIKKAKFTT